MFIRRLRFSLPLTITLLTVAAICVARQAEQGPVIHFRLSNVSLAEARRGFTTHLISPRKTLGVIPKTPRGYEIVHYDAPLGSFPAIVATVPSPDKNAAPVRHPAIIWLIGGFDNGISNTPSRPADADNDQSAKAFHEAGIVTMYPSLRGGNNNPGYIEGNFGEVDDVIAAAKYLATRPDVDPTRIYLGGHSTGGTLALLVAESTDAFRAVFSFGPASLSPFSKAHAPFDTDNEQELMLRAPVVYLKSINRPTFLFEGSDSPSNNVQLHELAKYSRNALITCYDLPGRNHFSELAPITPLIAKAIVADSGAETHIDFTANAADMVPIPRISIGGTQP